MGLTFPLTLPELGVVEMSLDPDILSSRLYNRGGSTFNIGLAPILWKGKVSTRPLFGNDYDYWRAWLSSMEMHGRFYIYDFRRRFPSAYKNGFSGLTIAVGGSSFSTGICTLTTVSSLDAHDLTLGGLPASFVFTAGDYLAFDYASGAKRALHRVTIGGVSSGSGVVSLSVTPPVVPGWVTGAYVYLDRPSMVGAVADLTTTEFGSSGVGASKSVISFNVIQSVRK